MVSIGQSHQPRHIPGSWRSSLILLCLLSLASGCNQLIAEKLVRAPNRNSPIRGKDAPAALLSEHYVWKQLRVNVGPPSASLSVWIVEPLPGPGTLWIGPRTHGRPVGWVRFDPQTRPSTVNAATLPITRPTKPPKATIFLLHGLGQDKEFAPVEFYSLITASEGYRVVLVDLRGHGRSTGDRLTFGATESRDLVQTLDALERQGLIAGQVGVVGISYGGAVAISWAGIDPRVHAVVALEPFSSLREAAVDIAPVFLGSLRWLFSARDIQDIVTRVGRLGAFDPDRESPLAAITRMSTPVLLIHGKDDHLLPPANSIHLHDAAPNHSRLILVDDASHIDLWIKGLQTITTESNAWFEKYLTRQPLPNSRPDK